MTTPSDCSAWASYADLPAGAGGMWSESEWCGYLQTATDVLWGATGRRWRGANLTEAVALRAAPPRAGEGSWPYHPSWGTCPCYLGIGPITGYGWGPQWRIEHGRHVEPAAIRLPRSDVTAVTSVLLDGAVFTDWALDGSWLARTDGRTWPACRDRTTVTYQFGHMPPEGGRVACITLAVEFGRLAAGECADQPCQLPRRLQSVTRQGIGYVALDDLSFLDKGLTGLYPVDAWIRAVNPKGRMQVATCWSPDIPMARSQ